VSLKGRPGYDPWIQSLQGEPDEADGWMVDDGGTYGAGYLEFTREIFDERGPISSAELDVEYNKRQLLLAVHAVELVTADLARTTSIDATVFEVSIRPVPSNLNGFEQLVVSYRGNYRTPVMSGMRHPESTVDVADNMQDHIIDELHRPWPMCPTHDRGLYATVEGDTATWYCRSGKHRLSQIGQLGA
jgi:hypothetical protein